MGLAALDVLDSVIFDPSNATELDYSLAPEWEEAVTTILPWTLRDYHHINAQVAAGLSVFLNILLCFLLRKEKNATFKSYSGALLMNCLVDVAFTLTNVATEMVRCRQN